MNASLGSRVFNVNVQFPDKYKVALEAGVNFIQLQYPTKGNYPRQITGFYNIIAKKYLEPGSATPRYSIKTLTGYNAHITFEIMQEEGTLIAFCPDDKYWHNRVMLVDNPGLQIAMMHTYKDGIIPGTVIKSEIQAIREVINEQVPIFKIVNQFGSEYTFKYTEEEAEEKKNTYPNSKLLKIVPGTTWQKKPEILEMIRMYKKLPNGWTSCDDFQNTIKPLIKAKIEEKNRSLVLAGQSTANPADLKSQILTILQTLTPEEKKKLLHEAEKAKSANNPSRNNNEPESETNKEEGVPVKHTKSKLKSMRLEELQRVAENMSLDTTGKTRDTLIEEILYEQDTSQPTIPIQIPGNEFSSDEDEEIVT